jgi:hypothetical protein
MPATVLGTDNSIGVKARSDIPLGTFLGIYSGELISEQETERRGLIYEVVGRTYVDLLSQRIWEID